MCNCHSILECCVMFSGVKLGIRSFNLFLFKSSILIKVSNWDLKRALDRLK